MGFKVNTSGFENALKNVLAFTSREYPKVINGAAIEIITTAAKLTKKADVKDIEKKLFTSVISQSIGKSGKTLKNPKIIAYKPTSMVYKILNARRTAKGEKGLNNSDMSTAAQMLIKRRKSAVGFVAYAGWQKALLAFGGRGFGKAASHKEFEKSTARNGYGIKAMTGSLFAKMVNTAAACEKYGKAPLQEAVDLKAKAFIKRLEEKLSGKCRDVSR